MPCAVNAVLALQVAVGILATLNLHGNALYSGLVAVLKVGNGDAIAMRLCPPHIHTHEHLGPVLALGATGSRVDFQHTVHRILLLAQHIHQLQVLDSFHGIAVVGVYLLLCDHLVLVEIKGQGKLVGAKLGLFVAFQPLLNALDLLHLLLRTLRVIPEIGSLSAQLLLLEFYFLCINIKVTVQVLAPLLNVFELFGSYHTTLRTSCQ